LPVYHVEGLWVHPDHRGGRAGLTLWNAMRTEARAAGVEAVVTHAVTDQVTALIAHVGGMPLPGIAHLIPVGEP
jgi:N-acetylglutamate synthase-like GNAT family acetyltransferase